MSTWPKRPDGTNKTMGEMSPSERLTQFRLAALRLKAEFESPAFVKAIAERETIPTDKLN